MSAVEMLGQPTAFVPSLDLASAQAFYEGILGLGLIYSDDYAVVLSSGSIQVRVTAVPTLTPQPFTVLGWNVVDIGATVELFVERGVELLRFEGMGQDERGVWAAPSGASVAWFHDPDGNTLSVTQVN